MQNTGVHSKNIHTHAHTHNKPICQHRTVVITKTENRRFLRRRRFVRPPVSSNGTKATQLHEWLMMSLTPTRWPPLPPTLTELRVTRPTYLDKRVDNTNVGTGVEDLVEPRLSVDQLQLVKLFVIL